MRIPADEQKNTVKAELHNEAIVYSTAGNGGIDSYIPFCAKDELL